MIQVWMFITVVVFMLLTNKKPFTNEMGLQINVYIRMAFVGQQRNFSQTICGINS